MNLARKRSLNEVAYAESSSFVRRRTGEFLAINSYGILKSSSFLALPFFQKR